MKKPHGFALVEMLIASTIGLVIIGSFISIFLSNSQTYSIQQAIEVHQRKSGYVLDRLVSITQNTGYLGCYGNLDAAGIENMLNTPNSVLWNIGIPVQGLNNVADDLDLGGISGFVEDTDILLLKRMRGSVLLNASTSASDLTIDTAGQMFLQGQIMIISDCDKASIFQATVLSDDLGSTTIDHQYDNLYTPGNSTGVMNNSYHLGAEVGELETLMFYLKSGANGRPALFEARLTVTNGKTVLISEQEALPNVDDFQIIYGEDTDDDQNIDFYRNADNVVDNSAIISVKIALLISSERSSISIDENSFTFNETKFTYIMDETPSNTADRRLRRVITGVGTFRNRVL